MVIEQLISLQHVEFEILCLVDRFCSEHDIKYSLYGGTLIGAVRHQGFIPWDDDLDIVMTRDQYTKFCVEWKLHPIEGYYLENLETDLYTQNTHAKIRKDGTILLSDVEDEKVGHHGIWIDIFVMDKVSKDSTSGRRVIKYGRKMILMAKANGHLPRENIKKRIARHLLKIVYPKKMRRVKLLDIVNFLQHNDQVIHNHYEWCDMCTLEYLKIRFPQATGDAYNKMKFEGREFLVFSNYDEVLKIMYGDYMRLPPIEEQVCKHTPVKIEF